VAGEVHRPVGRKIREIGGRHVVFDGEGFFDDPDDWSEMAAQVLSMEVGLDTMTIYTSQNTAFSIYHRLMRSLDQAFMARQGLAVREPEQWGERFFSGLDKLYPSWSKQDTDVYRVANHLLHRFAHTHRDSLISRSICFSPESFVRLVILLLQNKLLLA